jgi:hypothetical protein
MRKGSPILVCTPALKDAFVRATGIGG